MLILEPSTKASMEFDREILGDEIQVASVAPHFQDFCYEGEQRVGLASGGACKFKVGFYL